MFFSTKSNAIPLATTRERRTKLDEAERRKTERNGVGEAWLCARRSVEFEAWVCVLWKKPHGSGYCGRRVDLVEARSEYDL
ncbi:uncharacterized protein G2W53_026824 [Senna tora]|uniref:Uncharacterized protein n=1 Tax=Senna tora TaxID=362788 RepID=A0A834TPT0_9FABA|nr:uncharacterized protein G2W53_026824 [Senna tora]